MSTSINSLGVTFPDTTTQTTAAATSPIPATTVMLFYQSAAPTGWTLVTTQNNKALRVVSSAGGVAGGTTAFSTVFANQTPTISNTFAVSATTLTTAQMPSHTHAGYPATGGCAYVSPARPYAAWDGVTGPTSDTGLATGGGGSHTHSFSGSATSSAVTLNVQYIDIILASKN